MQGFSQNSFGHACFLFFLTGYIIFHNLQIECVFIPQKDEVYLNLVLEYVPETVYRVSRHFSKAKANIPIFYVKVKFTEQTFSKTESILDFLKAKQNQNSHYLFF